ncbi:MAG: SH3 domain-containing protein [Gammaproteobacteria bacterium]|nr:SH3 domain-containing protein [Gammaproteobacteria bacterium]
MSRKPWRYCLLLIVLVVPAAASQDGVIVRSAAVFADASSNSPQVGELVAGTRVSIFSRKGGWQEVFVEQQAVIGWVRSYQVRAGNFDAPASVETGEDSRGFLAGLASFSRRASSFFSTRSGSTSSGTATIGVRGLSEAEINAAQADFVELEKMDRFASGSTRMPAFTRTGKLEARSVAHIAGR